jgi:hypothetical protein
MRSPLTPLKSAGRGATLLITGVALGSILLGVGVASSLGAPPARRARRVGEAA